MKAKLARQWLLVVLVVSAPFAGCYGLLLWLAQPRIHASEVQAFLDSSMKVGMSKDELRAWLARRHYGSAAEFKNKEGRTVVGCWIMDTGSSIGLMPDDIRIEFVFDEQEHLARWAAKTESRF